MSLRFTVLGKPEPAGPSPRTDLDRAMALAVAIGGQDHRIHALRVEGEPIAKARARVTRGRAYTPQRTLDAEEDIAWAVKRSRIDRFDGNVAVAIVFYRSNRHRIDTDNLIKTVLDGITKSQAVWLDDSHVTAIAGVTEHDADWPRTAIAIAPHSSSLTRGDDALSHACETCGKRYRPHSPNVNSRYCSRACRSIRVQVCADCGGPTSAPHVTRCRSCHDKQRGSS